nr:MAG TPA: hypothetical protein [Caudoviricetes sp.]
MQDDILYHKIVKRITKLNVKYANNSFIFQKEKDNARRYSISQNR